MPGPPRRFHRTLAAVAVVLLVIGAALLVLRGVRPGLNPATNIDTPLIMLGARTWLEGGNPYSVDDAAGTWMRLGGNPAASPAQRGPQAFVYPPAGWAVFSPVAAAPPGWWIPLWLAVNTGLWALAALGAARLAGLSGRFTWGALVVGLALALGGAHTSLRLGQTGVLIAAMLVSGEALRAHGRPIVGGALLGAAAAVKPQLAGLFLLYHLFAGRWPTLAGAGAGGLVLTAVGVARLEVAGVAWLPQWVQNMRAFAVGGDADPLALGRLAFMIENLQGPLRVVIHERWALNAAAWATCAALAGAYAWAAGVGQWGNRPGYRQAGRLPHGADTTSASSDLTGLLALSLVSLLTLLCAYHRYYDATILLFPIALAVRLLHDALNPPTAPIPDRRALGRAAVTLALLAPMMVPGPAALFALQERGHIPSSIAESGAWKMLALGHHTWALLLLACWIVYLRATMGDHRDPARTELP